MDNLDRFRNGIFWLEFVVSQDNMLQVCDKIFFIL